MSYKGAQIGQIFEQGPEFLLIHQEAPELPETPESELQARFQLATGICCPREARIQMEKLMRHHGFTAHEIKSVWSVGTLQFPYHATKLKVVTSKWEAAWGWFMLALFALYGTDIIVRLAGLIRSGTLSSFGIERPVYALGLLVAFGVAIFLVVKHHIAPRRIAIRLRKALEKLNAS